MKVLKRFREVWTPPVVLCVPGPAGVASISAGIAGTRTRSGAGLGGARWPRHPRAPPGTAAPASPRPGAPRRRPAPLPLAEPAARPPGRPISARRSRGRGGAAAAIRRAVRPSPGPAAALALLGRRRGVSPVIPGGSGSGRGGGTALRDEEEERRPWVRRGFPRRVCSGAPGRDGGAVPRARGRWLRGAAGVPVAVFVFGSVRGSAPRLAAAVFVRVQEVLPCLWPSPRAGEGWDTQVLRSGTP